MRPGEFLPPIWLKQYWSNSYKNTKLNKGIIGKKINHNKDHKKYEHFWSYFYLSIPNTWQSNAGY